MQNTVLVVDDVEMNRDILEDMLSDDFGVVEAADGDAALSLIENDENEFSAVLLDLLMPGTDGFQVLQRLNSTGYLESVPVLVITGETDPDTEGRCLDMGAYDFIHKPFDPRLVRTRVQNAVRLYNYRHNLEQQVAEQTAALVEKNRQLSDMTDRTIDMLSFVVEARDLESGEHVIRVKHFTRVFAEILMQMDPSCGLTPAEIDIMESTAPMHDIGKIRVKDAVLQKKGRLTDEEFDHMRLHTVYGYELLQDVKDVWNEDYSRMAGQIARSHHERYDGTGYPDHLAGEDIPVCAQIVALADVWDALVNDRVYRKAIDKDVAFNMIINGECGAFSPRMTEVFKKARPYLMENFKASAPAHTSH